MMRCLTKRPTKLATEVGRGQPGGISEDRGVKLLEVPTVHQGFGSEKVPGAMDNEHVFQYRGT